jgi:hypothetical protein
VGGRTPLLEPGDFGNAIRTEQEAAAWRDAGGKWVGGTIKGLTTKVGYQSGSALLLRKGIRVPMEFDR